MNQEDQVRLHEAAHHIIGKHFNLNISKPTYWNHPEYGFLGNCALQVQTDDKKEDLALMAMAGEGIGYYLSDPDDNYLPIESWEANKEWISDSDKELAGTYPESPEAWDTLFTLFKQYKVEILQTAYA